MKEKFFNTLNNIKTKHIIALTLLLSLVAHMFLLSSHHNLGDFKFSKLKEQKKVKKIKLVFKSSKKNKKQIVTTENKGRKEKPQDTKFLSKQNNKVERETVARKTGKFKRAGKGTAHGQKQVQQKQAHAKKVAKVIKKKTKKGFTTKKKKISLADLSLNASEQIKIKPTRAIASINQGIAGGVNGQSGLAQNNDFVEDIPLGDMTSLNTTEYKYYGFYFRIKQKLEQHWGSTLQKKAEKLFKSGRRLPASENRITSLSIKLDDKGKIIDVFVKGTSGVHEFDEAAIESFNKAGPFPNPPKGMIKNGYAKIEWGFVVKG